MLGARIQGKGFPGVRAVRRAQRESGEAQSAGHGGDAHAIRAQTIGFGLFVIAHDASPSHGAYCITFAMPTHSLAKQMRRTRLDRKLTQSELASLLGISQEMVSMVESGTKDMPDDWVSIVRRWIATGKTPSRLELGARYRNPGK
jgi:DNA-binding XRE family transcriptional regulator